MVSITMGCQSCITMFRSRPIKLEKLACRAVTVRRSEKMQDGFFFSIIENLERTLKVEKVGNLKISPELYTKLYSFCTREMIYLWKNYPLRNIIISLFIEDFT